MNEQDFYKKLEEINTNILGVTKAVTVKGWKSLYGGILYGFGSIIGAVLALVILGWILNVFGVIPAFKNQVVRIEGLLQQAEQQRLPNVRSSQ